MRYELTDDDWAAIYRTSRALPRVNDRRVLNGIYCILRSGAPWRDLRDNFGPYTTCYNRFVRWRRAGVWAKIMNALANSRRASLLLSRLHRQAKGATKSNRRYSCLAQRPLRRD